MKFENNPLENCFSAYAKRKNLFRLGTKIWKQNFLGGNRTKPPVKLNRLLCRLSYFGIINSYRNTVFISAIGDYIYFSYMTIYTNTAYTTYQMCGLGVIRTAVIFLANLTAR